MFTFIALRFYFGVVFQSGPKFIDRRREPAKWDPRNRSEE